MISREEKNKSVVKKLQKEKALNIGNKLLRCFLIIVIIVLAFFFYMYYIGAKGLTTKEIIIHDTNIPSSFYGTKILHISDILYGSTIDNNYLDKLLDEIELINPDIVFFTGNLIMEKYPIKENEISYINEFFKNIPYKLGKYAIKGNFDDKTFDLVFDNTNFNIIENDMVHMYNKANEVISIIGINTNEVKNITSENDNYKIALINNYDDYAKYDIDANLVFAGNNLGGEIRLFDIPILGKNKYKGSFYQENNSMIYISSGLGTIHHVRFMNHPSINVYRLYNK